MNLSSSSGQNAVLLIGASGFVGRRILQALQGRSDTLVSILARRSTDLFFWPRPKVLLGDVTDPASVHAAVRDADIVINASSYVGNDPKIAENVNWRGTLSIIRACKSENVRRLVHVSSAAVYGSGPHRSLNPWEAPYRPESVASRSRAVADQAVLSAGGIVVRPNLIHGSGDRWFIPGAVRMFQTLGKTIEDGRALLSTIDVTDLGRLVAALAVTWQPAAGAYHAAYPTPLPLSGLLAAIDQHLAPRSVAGTSTVDDAIRTLAPAGFSPHQVRMLGVDHHYEAQALWELTGIPLTEFHISHGTHDWYRDRMAR